jgi:transmembrane sensor
MNYSEFKIDDFVLDEAFMQWVVQGENDAFWQAFSLEHPQQKEAMGKAKDFILAARQVAYPQPSTSTQDRMWHNIEKATTNSMPLKIVSQRWVWRVAAAVIVLAMAGGVWAFFSKDNALSTPSVFGDKNAVANEVKTEYQQRKQLTLPDGSVVTLNANTKIKVSDNWSDENTREVWLDGEAFFEVVKKPNTGAAKFVVHTPQLNVEVLGTAFNVKARRGATEVVLQSGKVTLNKVKNTDFKEIVMIPGDRVRVADEALKSVISDKVETEKVTAWTNGKIIFDNTPLLEVAKAIEDHFGYEVILEDKQLVTKLYTGELLTDSPDVFFTVLSKTLGIKINIEGKKMIIKGE